MRARPGRTPLARARSAGCYERALAIRETRLVLQP
jgi:hypothetical protein